MAPHRSMNSSRVQAPWGRFQPSQAYSTEPKARPAHRPTPYLKMGRTQFTATTSPAVSSERRR